MSKKRMRYMHVTPYHLSVFSYAHWRMKIIIGGYSR